MSRVIVGRRQPGPGDQRSGKPEVVGPRRLRCVEATAEDPSTCGEVGAAAGFRQPGPCVRKKWQARGGMATVGAGRRHQLLVFREALELSPRTFVHRSGAPPWPRHPTIFCRKESI